MWLVSRPCQSETLKPSCPKQRGDLQRKDIGASSYLQYPDTAEESWEEREKSTLKFLFSYLILVSIKRLKKAVELNQLLLPSMRL